MIKEYLVPAAIGLLLIAIGHPAIAENAPSKELAVGSINITLPKITHLQNAKPTHVLFVGNSYLYYNDSLHNHVQRMAVAARLLKDSEISYKSATIGGAALRDHNIDHLLKPANLRVDKSFEVVILQGGSGEPLSERRRQIFADTAADFVKKIRQAGGEPVLYMTHSFVVPHKKYRPGMIQDIASLYIETGNELNVLVIPVGLAFEIAYQRRPDIKLHKSFDGTHPEMLGTYLAAATVFASLYGVSPVGNSYDYFGEVSADDSLFLQTVAWDTVTGFYGMEE
jgi:hypothetical protein